MKKDPLEVVRLWLLIVLLIGLFGTGVELLLLKHVDGAWQLAPLALVAGSLIVLAWYAVGRSLASLRAHQFVMILFIASGAIGTIQHFRGNVAYERESNPSLSGFDLYRAALMGSTPSLAPGTMIQLGLIGLMLTYRHPLYAGSTKPANEASTSRRTL